MIIDLKQSANMHRSICTSFNLFLPPELLELWLFLQLFSPPWHHLGEPCKSVCRNEENPWSIPPCPSFGGFGGVVFHICASTKCDYEAGRFHSDLQISNCKTNTPFTQNKSHDHY